MCPQRNTIVQYRFCDATEPRYYRVDISFRETQASLSKQCVRLSIKGFMSSTIGKSPPNNRKPIEPTIRRVAQYVRMSTDHQRYSIESQMAAIAEYAHCNEMTVVHTYPWKRRRTL